MLALSTWLHPILGTQLKAMCVQVAGAQGSYCQCQHSGYNASREMPRQKPYHHGNLREELLEAAIRLIAEVGPTAFTLREVARRAGVSHNAPYRHFRDRDDLMPAVAAQAFRELPQTLMDAAGQRYAALHWLKRSGLGFEPFALRRPEHF